MKTATFLFLVGSLGLTGLFFLNWYYASIVDTLEHNNEYVDCALTFILSVSAGFLCFGIVKALRKFYVKPKCIRNIQCPCFNCRTPEAV